MAKIAKKKSSVLGRGLGNLLNEDATSAASNKRSGMVDIPVSKIRMNPDNPRKKFDKTRIEELAATIKEHGLLQPVLVSLDKDHYRLIAGERRLKAVRSLNLKKIPAIIKSGNDQKSHAIALIENIQREQLDAIEEAAAYRLLIDQHELTQEELATKVGKNRTTITNRLRLLNLPLNIQTNIADGKLTEGQVRPLLSLKNNEVMQTKIAERILKEGLNSREIEELVRTFNQKTKKVAKKSLPINKKPADIKALEKKIENIIKLRAKLKHNEKKGSGQLIIDYFSIDDLDKILKKLGIKK